MWRFNSIVVLVFIWLGDGSRFNKSCLHDVGVPNHHCYRVSSQLLVKFISRRKIENSKKIAKTFKKLKNTILAPFQAKIGCKTQRKRENKNCDSVPFRSRHEIENSKTKAKKFKKLKYTIMASFQAKIGWKMMRKREYKKYRSVSFLPDAK